MTDLMLLREWLNMYGAVRGKRALFAYGYGASWSTLARISP